MVINPSLVSRIPAEAMAQVRRAEEDIETGKVVLNSQPAGGS